MQLMKKPAHSLSHIIYLSLGLIPVPPISNPDKRCDYAQKWARWSVTTNSDCSQQINQIFWPRPIGIDWIWMPFNNGPCTPRTDNILSPLTYATQQSDGLEKILYLQGLREIFCARQRITWSEIGWWWSSDGKIGSGGNRGYAIANLRGHLLTVTHRSRTDWLTYTTQLFSTAPLNFQYWE